MSWLFLYLLTGTLLTCGAQEYYVTPTPSPNTNCPSHKPCHTLDYYARNAFDLINGRENVSLLFMSGYHNSETVFEIANVDVLTIAGLDFDLQNPSKIGSTQMLISNGTVFTLKNIAISNTTLNVSDFQSMTNYEIYCENSILSVRALQVDNVLLTHSKLSKCAWLLYWGYTKEIGYFDPIRTSAVGISTKTNIEPSIEISETEVLSESVTYLRLARSGNISVHLNIGFCSFLKAYGFVVTAHTVGEHLPQCELVIRMDHCSMTDDLVGIIIDVIKTQNVQVDISNSKFMIFNNSKAILITSIENNINATIKNSEFESGFVITAYALSQSTLNITVSRCTFTEAKLDSIRLFNDGGIMNGLIDNCKFINGFNSDPALIKNDRVILVYAFTADFRSTIVLKNSLIQNNHFLTGILTILGLIHMTIDNCTIKDNSAIVSGGLLGYYSNITFMGDTIFENNTGAAGGAIYLYESQLTFAESLNLVFINNKVETAGGAIFIAETGSQTYINEIVRVATEPNLKCFYQLETDITNNSTLPSITFINNTAQSGGDNIYGAALKDDCTVTPNTLDKSYEIQETLFHFHPVSQSSVSSSPRRVCACEKGKPKCTDIDYIFMNKSVTPGEKVSLEVILVGHDFGATTGGIFATEVYDSNNNRPNSNSLVRQEEIQISNSNKCTTVHYSIKSTKDANTTFILTASTLNADEIIRVLYSDFQLEIINNSLQEYYKSGLISTDLLYTPVTVRAHVQPCPLGLEIDNNTEKCGCRNELLEANLATECNIKNETTFLITRSPLERAWFRLYNNSNHGLIFEYGFSCLYAYCNSVPKIDPRYPDSQCALNHSGVLCGGCAEGLSLAIGSNRCLECPDNAHLSLVLFFLLIGVLLVLYIWILDLTISRGTINGLLFYVNMVSINRNIFFVENTDIHKTLNGYLQAAKVFIDWCNLDVGVESCFIYRLDATGKIWLQFLFPLYIWGLACLIIVACKYSTRLTKLFGDNSVSVLLTLFLIAYMKLVRTIIAAFSFTNIQTLNSNSFYTVWLVDGNVKYNSVRHIVLRLVSGISAILLLTVTIWLLLIKLTWKLPQHHKIDPILHSFTGQLKKNHEYWIGLSLMTRVLVAIMAILLPRDTLLSILIVILFILAFALSQVYKKIYLSLLEFVFLLNLLIVSAIYLSQTENRTLAISISVSVFISALVCFAISIYHGLKTAKTVLPKIVKYLSERYETNRRNGTTESDQVPSVPTSTEVQIDMLSNLSLENQRGQQPQELVRADYSQYREKLLDSADAGVQIGL